MKVYRVSNSYHYEDKYFNNKIDAIEYLFKIFTEESVNYIRKEKVLVKSFNSDQIRFETTIDGIVGGSFCFAEIEVQE